MQFNVIEKKKKKKKKKNNEKAANYYQQYCEEKPAMFAIFMIVFAPFSRLFKMISKFLLAFRYQ